MQFSKYSALFATLMATLATYASAMRCANSGSTRIVRAAPSMARMLDLSPMAQLMDMDLGMSGTILPTIRSIHRNDVMTTSQLPQLYIDVAEDKKEYVVTADVPGIRQDAITIDVKDDVLIVSAERKRPEPSEENGETLRRQERVMGSVERRLTLPDDANQASIDAQLELGVLKITIPKLEQPKETARRIEIGAKGSRVDAIADIVQDASEV